MAQTSFASSRPEVRYAWCGPSLVVVHDQGWIDGEALTGYYFREARHLSGLRLEIDGECPFLCAIGRASPHELALAFVHPELRRFGAGGSGLSGQEARDASGLPPRALDLRLRYRVHPAALAVRLVLTNRTLRPLEMEVAWAVSADYADLAEAHAHERQQEAQVEGTLEADGVRFRYRHPLLPLETHLAVTGGDAWEWAGGRLRARLRLAPQEAHELGLHITPIDPDDPLDAAEAERRERHLERWRAGRARLQTPGNERFAEMVNQAMDDVGSFALLEGSEAEWLAPAAGVPLYPALFGRDALVTGWQAMLLDRGRVAEAALTRLQALQGERVAPERDEEPGRILQQARRGPLARLGVTPFARYYGDYASPFDFVITLGQLYAWTGERACLDRHWEAARRVLVWAEEHGDLDGDGYLEYLTRSPQGPVHQGWKDSGGAVVHADGRDAEPPLALAEVQGYHFVALQTMAALSAARGEPAEARALWQRAARLKEAFNRDFWMEDESFLAMALDRDKRPVRSIGSNAGQCLATGIVADEHVPRLVRRLFEPDLFSGWGIRTLSARHPAYHPLSYHRGSVWPVENGTIVFGLRRYGLDDRALELARALFDLAAVWGDYRTPECVGGYARDDFPHPGAYPRANVPQAWNQGALALLTQAVLGILPLAPLRTLFLDPVLPPWLPQLVLRDLRVGDARLSLRFFRDEAGDSHFEVLDQDGDLRLLRQPPLDDLAVGFGTRLGLLARDLLTGAGDRE